MGVFCGGGGGVGLSLILLNMGYYTLYEKSCILERDKLLRKLITKRQFEPHKDYNDLK